MYLYNKNINGKRGLFKFVKFENGDYLFGDAEIYDHKMLAARHENLKVVAAGAIGINDIWWQAYGWYSATLKVGCGAAEVEELKELLDVPYKEDLS